MATRAVATKCEVFRGENGKHYFRAKSRNGRTISQSQGYSNRTNARRGAKRAFPDAVLVNV